ncbi:hypothetical protein POM88_049087 [Heracleum sosnowskyi]|uniref:Ig-like domain-containing protein n=1 Tax=Heracleum sosnowskyi TaxID=360622 RepID=A0AAD8M099_9APIA|nr:hypothetical protein POM88_049087 [Heracleum sosnowskyi]
MLDKTNLLTRGFGFILFSDPSVVEAVLYDEHSISGRIVQTMRCVGNNENLEMQGYLEWYRGVKMNISLPERETKSKPKKLKLRASYDHHECRDFVESVVSTLQRMSLKVKDPASFEELPSFVNAYETLLMQWQGPPLQRHDFNKAPLASEGG